MVMPIAGQARPEISQVRAAPMPAITLKLTGEHLRYPTEEAMREFLFACAAQFHNATGIPRSEICRCALNDPGFLSQVETGRHIKIRTFETVMRWLDLHWPADSD